MSDPTRTVRALLAACLALPLALSAGPQTKPATKPAAPKDAPALKIDFEKYTLPNGLQVILHVDRKLPVVHVNQWFHVGSKNEKPGRTGFAHLFEHMMFQGSKNASEDYFTYVERLGANLREGGVNGTTNNDRTNYFATVPSGNLETLLWLESDRLLTLPDALTKEKLDNQRDVVKNERRQGLENQPYGRAFKLLTENLFPQGHPYSWTVIGSHEDLTAASLEDVSDFFKTYYTPNNLSLVVAGDFDPAEARRLVEKYFASIPAGPPLDRPRRSPASLTSERVMEATDRVPQERVYIAWPSPEYFAEGDADLDLAALVLTDGLSSRLSKALVYDKKLCTNVQSFQNADEIAGGFIAIATARPGSSLPEVEKVITEEIARLAKTGPTAAELARAKTKQEYGFVSALEGLGGFGGKADRLNQYNTYLGDPGKIADDLGRYRAATVESVRKAVDRYLNTTNRLVVRFRPETGGRAAASTVDRSKEPATGADKPFRTPEVKSATLGNGLTVLVVERPELPKVSVSLTTRAGTVSDPAGKEGLAHLTTVTIDMGTRTRKALEIEDALGDLGTSLTGGAAREHARLGLEVLKRNLAPALMVVGDVVQNPTYPDSEFEREKGRHLDNLKQQANNPNAVAARVRSMLLFGAQHPYGKPAQGLPSTVSTITRADAEAHHKAYWKPGSSALVFVGDVTLAEATELAGKAFGAWSGGAAPVVTIPAFSPAPTGRLYVVDKQDASQTVISQFLPAPPRKAPDYYDLQLADAVYGGGGFGTRLNLNLRESKGYSYGVFSNMAFFEKGGAWSAGGGVQTNKTKESMVEFKKELDELTGARPITQAELEAARTRKIRGYAQQFETLGRIGQQVADLWVAGLPFSELQREYDAAASATLPKVLESAKGHAAPSKAGYVLVGDVAKIRKGLEELGMGEIVVLDAEGRVAGR